MRDHGERAPIGCGHVGGHRGRDLEGETRVLVSWDGDGVLCHRHRRRRHF